MVSLVDWHRRIHGVTGAMALRWCQATAEDLAEWARELRAVAEAMEAAAAQPPSRVAVNAAEAADGAKTSDCIPDWLLQDTDL
jgi:hypothetical protein